MDGDTSAPYQLSRPADAETRLQWLMVSVSVGFLGVLAFLPAKGERTGLETGPVASVGVCVGAGPCSDRKVARGTDERLSASELDATRRVDAGESQRIP